MARGRRAKRKARREARRAERLNAKQIIGQIAFEVYEPGDDYESLEDKVIERIEDDGSLGPIAKILLLLLKEFLPLILRALLGSL